MIRHIVVFRWKPGTTSEQVSQIADELRTLPGRIPEIKAYHCGPDAGITPGVADFAVTADFDDEAGYVTYRDHPDHKEIIARLITPLIAERSPIQIVLV
jgi:hypothetical protein